MPHPNTVTLEDIVKRTEGLGIQMQPIELFEIARHIRPPMNVLVFGLGNDSAFWNELNKGGRTVFIEDKQKWFRDITDKHPFLEAYQVEYGTKREQWRELIDEPERLELDIPSELKSVAWDAIIVDGPAGHEDGTPGRMKSIYMTSRLIKTSGDVFVHDAQREVEAAYCEHYLLSKNFVSEVKGMSVLQHYKMESKEYRGIVVQGSKRATRLGFPTINIVLHDPSLSGIYIASVREGGRTHAAAAFAGPGEKLLEAYLLDFDGDWYGKEVAITLIRKIRDSRIFNDDEELKRQISQDVDTVRAYFKKALD